MENRKGFAQVQKVVWAIFLVGCISLNPAFQTDAQPIARQKLDAYDVIRLVNHLRLSNGLPAFQVYNELMR